LKSAGLARSGDQGKDGVNRPLTLQRTEWNVRDSDATIIFTMTDVLDGGSKRTAQFAERLHRPLMHFRPGVHEKYLLSFLVQNRITTLNVAGKRESSAPGIYQFTFDILNRALWESL
jgi:hypothetical protein